MESVPAVPEHVRGKGKRGPVNEAQVTTLRLCHPHLGPFDGSENRKQPGLDGRGRTSADPWVLARDFDHSINTQDSIRPCSAMLPWFGGHGTKTPAETMQMPVNEA